MRIPWRATLDALMAELRRHIQQPPSDEELDDIRIKRILEQELERVAESGRQLGVSQDDARQEAVERARRFATNAQLGPEQRIHEALVLLHTVRLLLPSESPLQDKLRLSDRERTEIAGDLDQIDSSRVRYPDHESLDEVARFVEAGGLFGPILGKHIADIMRGKPVLRHASGQLFEAGRHRRFTVKQCVTIAHLYDVGLQKATRMFCELEGEDDPDGKAEQRFEKWIKDDKKRAKKKLADQALHEQDRRHWEAILNGLRPDLPRGHLKDESFPEAYRALMKQRQ